MKNKNAIVIANLAREITSVDTEQINRSSKSKLSLMGQSHVIASIEGLLALSIDI